MLVPQQIITRQALYGLTIFAIVSFCYACAPDTPKAGESSEFQIRMRLGFEPDRLNPMLSTSSQATQIERKIFLPLADYNPNTLLLEPILIREAPRISQITEGVNAGGARYDIEILQDAKWDDGVPITGFDYAFTMKAALDPYISNSAWQNHMDHIVEIVVDSTNPKQISVITNTQYILSESVVTTNMIYPAHIYDKDQMLAPYSFSDIKQRKSKQDTLLDHALRQFANQFNSDMYSRDIIVGAGPYKFVEWIPNQHIILEKKESWWEAMLPRGILSCRQIQAGLFTTSFRMHKPRLQHLKMGKSM